MRVDFVGTGVRARQAREDRHQDPHGVRDARRLRPSDPIGIIYPSVGYPFVGLSFVLSPSCPLGKTISLYSPSQFMVNRIFLSTGKLTPPLPMKPNWPDRKLIFPLSKSSRPSSGGGHRDSVGGYRITERAPGCVGAIAMTSRPRTPPSRCPTRRCFPTQPPRLTSTIHFFLSRSHRYQTL